MPFNPSELKYLLPRLQGAIPDEVFQYLQQISQFKPFQKFIDSSTNTTWRLAHFLGQCAYESGGFKNRFELLNYSASRLQILFPKYFPNQEIALAYANQPKRIASRVYADRMGNGDEASMEGFRFRGRGYLQLTGRDNYLHFSLFAGEDCLQSPDLIATRYPLLSAVFFFCTQSIWPLCDMGTGLKIHQQITLRINGGLHGVKNRYDYVQGFLELIGNIS